MLKNTPNFIIVGAQKSGTTSLFNYLSQHPQLVASNKKEVHFFDGGLDPDVDNYKKGGGWYLSHFPSISEIDMNFSENSLADIKTFEASPLYLFNPLVPQRIHSLLPNTKIIVVLRDPVERAISHYFHECRLGVEPLAIFEAFKAEEARLSEALKRGDFKNFNFIHYSYKLRGIYVLQLERYFKFFKREQIYVIHSADLFGDTEEALRRLFSFLGVEEGFPIDNAQVYGSATNRSPVDTIVYDYLNAYFEEYNHDLYHLLGVNYHW